MISDKSKRASGAFVRVPHLDRHRYAENKENRKTTRKKGRHKNAPGGRVEHLLCGAGAEGGPK